MKKNDNKLFFTSRLMQWNTSINYRDMPWKGEQDPYKIWLSEIILQQTRVAQGWEYYNRFIKQYPTVKKLAAAPDEAVFKLWEGLGYYSRCKNLIASAKYIAQNLKGIFPNSYNDILQLKGVGTYTAAAIASFAFNEPYAVVDGNVNRVLARFFNIELPIDSIKGKLFFADLAQQLLDKKSPGLYNQAIMDFGATLCKPKLPLCDECVLKKACKAFALGTVNILPVKENKIVKKQRWFFYILAEYKRNFYVIKRTKKDIWENLYEFVLIEVDKKIPPLEICQSAAFKKMFGKDFSVQNVSLFYKQQLTHQTINGYFIHIKLNTKPALPEYLHLSKSNMVKLAFPKFINNYLQSANTLL